MIGTITRHLHTAADTEALILARQLVENVAFACPVHSRHRAHPDGSGDTCKNFARLFGDEELLGALVDLDERHGTIHDGGGYSRSNFSKSLLRIDLFLLGYSYI